MNNNESRLVQMRLEPKTLESISHLSEITGFSNRTEIVKSAITLTEKLVENIKKGGKVYIENDDGTKQRLTFSGL